MIPFQYLKNKTTGKISEYGYFDLSDKVSDEYELVFEQLPENHEMEQGVTPVLIVEKLKEVYMSLPVQHRAALADYASKVSQAAGYGDYELAEYLVDNAEVPEGMQSVKSTMRNILGLRHKKKI